jgi:hypothetical protein
MSYPGLNANTESAGLFKNLNKFYENHLKLSSINLKTDPVKLHAYLKDTEYNQVHEIAISNQQREREQKLRIDEENHPFAVRSCVQQRDGSVKWHDMDDSICRDEVSVIFTLTALKFKSS